MCYGAGSPASGRWHPTRGGRAARFVTPLPRGGLVNSPPRGKGVTKRFEYYSYVRQMYFVFCRDPYKSKFQCARKILRVSMFQEPVPACIRKGRPRPRAPTRGTDPRTARARGDHARAQAPTHPPSPRTVLRNGHYKQPLTCASSIQHLLLSQHPCLHARDNRRCRGDPPRTGPSP
eukprot:COSAG02_NODE_1573_length_11882_cov_5.506832_5_plen_176_part_00